MAVAVAAWGCGNGGGAVVDATVGDAAPDGDPLTELEPGEPIVLGPGNAGGQDEDPSIATLNDGTLLVAWYSNRNGLQPDGRQDKEVFVTRSRDGRRWDPPVQVTRDVEWSFYPDLAVERGGTVHLAWWRFVLTPPGCNPDLTCTGVDSRLRHVTSADGVTWDLAGATEVTTGPGDWLPSVVTDAGGGQVRIYFAAVARNPDGSRNLAERRSHLYVTIGTGATWSAPVRLAGLDDGMSHDSYPDVARRADGTYVLTWTRYDGAADPSPPRILDTTTTETMVATSSDGLTFAGATVISDGGPDREIDVFPHLFFDQTGALHVTWITTALSTAGDQVELPVGGHYPADRVLRPEIRGYSASIVATRTPDVYFAAGVTGQDPLQEITGRFFRR